MTNFDYKEHTRKLTEVKNELTKLREMAPDPILSVFVLMPFEKSFDSIYQIGIKETCKNLNLKCERVDEQIFEGQILDRIYKQIEKSEIIISDMTGKNANVFYETGYAHGIKNKKEVILLTQKTEDIPFDLKHYLHIVYNNDILTLRKGLKERLEWYIEKKNKY